MSKPFQPETDRESYTPHSSDVLQARREDAHKKTRMNKRIGAFAVVGLFVVVPTVPTWVADWYKQNINPDCSEKGAVYRFGGSDRLDDVVAESGINASITVLSDEIKERNDIQPGQPFPIPVDLNLPLVCNGQQFKVSLPPASK